MNRVRNAIAILILCMIGGFSYNSLRHSRHDSSNGLGLPAVSPENLKDSVAQNASFGQGKKRGASDLSLGADKTDDLKDSVAQNPVIETGRNNAPGQQNGNPNPPRGGGDGGNGGPNGPNPGSQLPQNHNTPHNISPSGPSTPN